MDCRSGLIDDIFEKNTAETVDRTNPTYGILVQNVEDNYEDMDHIIDEMIVELRSEIILTGDDILDEMSESK